MLIHVQTQGAKSVFNVSQKRIFLCLKGEPDRRKEVKVMFTIFTDSRHKIRLASTLELIYSL